MNNQSLNTTKEILLQTYREWALDRTVRVGAGVAYYMLIALIPMFTLAFGIAGIIFTNQEIVEFFDSVLSTSLESSIMAVEDAVDIDLSGENIGNVLRSVGLVGVVGILITGSFLVVAMQDAVNTVWGKPVVRGFRASIRRYTLAYGLVLILASLLIVSLLIYAVTEFAIALIPSQLEFLEGIASLLGSGVSWLVLAGFFSLLLRIMLHGAVAWRHVLIGGVITAFALQVGTALIGIYFSQVGYNSVAGAFGGVLLVLGWMYYVAQILLVGVQLTKVLSYRAGNLSLKKAKRSDPRLAKP